MLDAIKDPDDEWPLPSEKELKEADENEKTKGVLANTKTSHTAWIVHSACKELNKNGAPDLQTSDGDLIEE